MTDPTTNDWAEVGLDENRFRDLLAAAFEAHPRQAEIVERRARGPTVRFGDGGELVISLATPAWEARGDGDHHQPLFMPSTSTGCGRRTGRELMEAAAPPGVKAVEGHPKRTPVPFPYPAKEKSAACRQAARRRRDPGGWGVVEDDDGPPPALADVSLPARWRPKWLLGGTVLVRRGRPGWFSRRPRPGELRRV